jgi:hypothetical protein
MKRHDTSEPRAQAGFQSFNWMRGVADDTNISVFQRFILMRLCLYRNDGGRCDPAYDTICNTLGVDRVTVVRAIAAGVRHGWLAQPTRRGPTSNSYAFTFPVNWKAEKDVAPERYHSPEEVAPENKRGRSRAQKR